MPQMKITRTFVETEVTFTRFTVKDGKMEQGKEEKIVFTGKMTEEKALSQIPLNGANGVVITGISTDEALYSMPLEKFKELATPVKK